MNGLLEEKTTKLKYVSNDENKKRAIHSIGIIRAKGYTVEELGHTTVIIANPSTDEKMVRLNTTSEQGISALENYANNLKSICPVDFRYTK